MLQQILALGVFATYVSAQSPLYGQCGGTGWTGPKTCVSGSTCVVGNPWYSQCLPGSSSPDPTPTTPTNPGGASPTDVTFCLAGDSTTASNGGWGDAFCQTTLQSGVTCKNLAKGGASTSSFIADSSGLSWKATLDCVRASKNKAKTFVTIQFGHNDQKNGDSYKPTYSANLRRMANDVTALGAHPILVTSLSRRNYSGGKIVDILEPWAVLVRQAASATGQPYIELLQTSITYLNAIGNDAAQRLNYQSGDRTHVNANGATVFSRMVADLIKAKGIVSPDPFKANPTLSNQIRDGVPSF
ncbi:hypothetical protein V493_04512 [Pseudogymnoascus sp. VKM F-4281 (FW-2241)]|nr:hypothetical protein V493_04512 [Pseudogymnoascus sp. VKM F-4281 (FW-2241)]